MLKEYAEIVTKLKTTNAHFKKVFDKYCDLDDSISKFEESGVDHISPIKIEIMKKERLLLKDEALGIVMQSKNQKT